MFPTGQRPRRKLAALEDELTHLSLIVRHIALCRLVHGESYRAVTAAQVAVLGEKVRQAQVNAEPTAVVLDHLVRQQLAHHEPYSRRQVLREAVVGLLCEHLRLPVHCGRIYAAGTYAWSLPKRGGEA